MCKCCTGHNRSSKKHYEFLNEQGHNGATHSHEHEPDHGHDHDHDGGHGKDSGKDSAQGAESDK